MSFRDELLPTLRLPTICAPMFLVSGPELVVAACRAGVVGAFPTINARTPDELSRWLSDIRDGLAGAPPGAPLPPFAANLIVHRTNSRLGPDLERCIQHEVPLVITSVGDPGDVVERVHAYGGRVLHDVASVRHARRAAAAGVDGMVLLCAGAGGQTGRLNPFAFVSEVRRFFDGLLAVAGGVTEGRSIAAIEVAGADLAYLGTAFIATRESRANDAYKTMVVDSGADDVLLTLGRTGLPSNMLAPSLERAGWSRDRLPPIGTDIDLTTLLDDDTSPWRDIWSAGHGVGGVTTADTTADVVARLQLEYEASRPG